MMKKCLNCFLVLLGILAFPVFAQGPQNPITAEDADNLRVVTLLRQHTAPLTEMRFSPQGTAFVTASLDGTLCVWNASTPPSGQQRFCVEGYTPAVTLHRWSDDDQTLAITDALGSTILIYDADGEPIQQLPTNEAPYLNLEFIGLSLLAHDVYDTYTLYAPLTGDILAQVEGMDSAATATQVAIVDFDGQVVIWDAETGEKARVLKPDEATHAEFASTGQLVTWGEQVQLWNPAESIHPQPLSDSRIDKAQFSPDGRWLVLWEGESASIWDAATGEQTSVMNELAGGLQSLTFTPDGQRIISIDSTGVGRLWTLNEAGVATQLLRFRNNIDRMFISPDSLTGIAARNNFAARFYNLENAQLRGQYEFGVDAVISPDWTIVATSVGNLVVWTGLQSDSRVFDFAPIGFTNQPANIRANPATDLARVALMREGDPVFAIGRTTDNQWLQIIMPDGVEGWLFTSNVAVQGNIEDLPIGTQE